MAKSSMYPVHFGVAVRWALDVAQRHGGLNKDAENECISAADTLLGALPPPGTLAVHDWVSVIQ